MFMSRTSVRQGLSWLLALGLSGSLSCVSPSVQEDSPQPSVFGLYAVWFAGSNDDDREDIDRFLECLIEGSTFNDYWMGEARVELRGSFALPAPSKHLDWDELAELWLAPSLGGPGGLPSPSPGEIPLYLIFGGQPDMWTGACGRNSEAVIAEQRVGVGVVRNEPLCWPTGDRVRTETQIATHEIIETVDRVLGHGTCAAGGTCRGRLICEDACASFVGLQCPGAPTASYTGCDDRLIDGWVIQKLGYAGRDLTRCDECMECDFTPTACPLDQPTCAQIPE